MDHPFRSAAVGGFNKQDVLTYLEEQAKQATQVQQELQSRLEEADRQAESSRREGEELRRELEEAWRELEALRQGQDGLNAQLEQARRDLSASQAQTAQMTRQLEQARKERDSLQSQLEALRPDAQAYVQLKERAAGVELEAHRRAQAVQEKAEGDIRRMRRQAEQWLQGLSREYGELRSQVEATISHAASELEKAGSCLDRAGQLMGEQELALEALSQAYDATASTRAEAPMPIPEE